jgi:hypothetical protein
MSPARVVLLSLACGAIAITNLAAASQAEPPDAAVPTAIEEALIEHSCGSLHPAGTVESEAYLDCRKAQLLSLRADFGRDLRRLSTAERARIDAACTGLRASRGQDAYVECLAAQLVTMRGRGGRTAQTPAAAPVAAAPETPSPTAPPIAPPAPGLPIVWIGAALAAVLAIAGGVIFVKMRARSAFGTCRTCGAKLTERGELCHACRHEAAEALRRATNERAEQARAAENDARRKQEAREQEEQQRARDEDTRRQQALAAQEAQAREQEEHARQRREEEERRRQQQQQTDAAASPGEFDPYAALGVPRTAGAAEIEAAYQEAKAKYDPELVSGLSSELQEHFRKKGEAAQRAYELLITPPRS